MARKKSLVIEILGNNKMGRAVRDAMGSLQRLGRSAAGVGRGIAKAFKFAAVGVAGFTAGMTYALRQTAKFNVQMARAWTMAGGGINVFKTMREDVMRLSAELGVAKDELSSGLYQTLSAGVSRDTAIDFLRIAAKTAITDGSSIETAVDGITTVINAFGFEAEKTQYVVDQMFNTVRGGKTTFSDLAANLSKAAPVAAALGVELEQVMAAVATMTKQGTPTEVALTSIRNAMLALNGQMGEGWAESNTFQQALEKVAKASNYSSVALERIFGKRDVAQVMQMVGDKAAAAAGDLDAASNSAGALAENFERVQQFRFWERLGQTLQTVATRFGQAVEEELDLGAEIDKASRQADKYGKAFADAVRPHIAELKTAIGDMLSGDETRVAEGKAAIEKMFADAGGVVKPYFVEWGEAAGAAIWRGFKHGGRAAGEAIYSSAQNEGSSTSAFRKWTSPLWAAGAGGGTYSAMRESGSGYLASAIGAFGAAGTEMKRIYGPGSSQGQPLYVQEVKPIDGVKSK